MEVQECVHALDSRSHGKASVSSISDETKRPLGPKWLLPQRLLTYKQSTRDVMKKSSVVVLRPCQLCCSTTYCDAITIDRLVLLLHHVSPRKSFNRFNIGSPLVISRGPLTSELDNQLSHIVAASRMRFISFVGRRSSNLTRRHSRGRGIQHT